MDTPGAMKVACLVFGEEIVKILSLILTNMQINDDEYRLHQGPIIWKHVIDKRVNLLEHPKDLDSI